MILSFVLRVFRWQIILGSDPQRSLLAGIPCIDDRLHDQYHSAGESRRTGKAGHIARKARASTTARAWQRWQRKGLFDIIIIISSVFRGDELFPDRSGYQHRLWRIPAQQGNPGINNRRVCKTWPGPDHRYHAGQHQYKPTLDQQNDHESPFCRPFFPGGKSAKDDR